MIVLTLKCLASGSSGNCYLLENDNEVLILDCGIPIKAIKQGLNWDISKVVGVAVSHGHSDHCKAFHDLNDMGILIFDPYRYCEPDYIRRDEMRAIKYGDFNITAFQLPHNGTANCGFYIRVDGQSILYMTDFEYCHYVFKNQKVNHILIEANHSKDLLDRDRPNYEHSVRGHADIEVTCKFLEVNKTEQLRNVILIHLSSECGDADLFKETAEKVVDCPVYVAEKGLSVTLNAEKKDECPF